MSNISEMVKAALEKREREKEGRGRAKKGSGREGNSKAAATLYLLGASLSQIATALDVQRGTAWSYVRNHLPEALRTVAREARGGRKGTLLETADVEEYLAVFEKRIAEFRDMRATEIAKKLQSALILDRSEEDDAWPENANEAHDGGGDK